MRPNHQRAILRHVGIREKRMRKPRGQRDDAVRRRAHVIGARVARAADHSSRKHAEGLGLVEV